MPLSLKRRLEHWIALNLGIPMAYLLFKILALTLRRARAGAHREFYQGMQDGQRYLIAFWHDDSFHLALEAQGIRHLGKTYIMTSPWRDGALMSRFLGWAGLPSVAGSTTHGGAKAILDLCRAMTTRDQAGLAVDGSRRAPRFSVQPGILMLARRTGMPIVPLAARASRKWVIGSKDRIEVPKPFARTTIHYGTPISVPRRCSAEEMEGFRLEITRQLAGLKGFDPPPAES